MVWGHLPLIRRRCADTQSLRRQRQRLARWAIVLLGLYVCSSVSSIVLFARSPSTPSLRGLCRIMIIFVVHILALRLLSPYFHSHFVTRTFLRRLPSISRSLYLLCRALFNVLVSCSRCLQPYHCTSPAIFYSSPNCTAMYISQIPRCAFDIPHLEGASDVIYTRAFTLATPTRPEYGMKLVRRETVRPRPHWHDHHRTPGSFC